MSPTKPFMTVSLHCTAEQTAAIVRGRKGGLAGGGVISWEMKEPAAGITVHRFNERRELRGG
jgi:hypothetical protein